jgi:hypothetical protein
MVQNMGGKSEGKSYLQNKHSAKFFAEEFIINFGQKALENFPEMDDKYIPSLKLELKKMQEIFYKSKKKPLAKTVKCCSIKCRSTGNLV